MTLTREAVATRQFILYELPQPAIEPERERYGTRPRFPFLLFDKTNDRRDG